MFKTSFQNITLAIILLLLSFIVSAQKVTEPNTKAEWSQPYKPFLTVANVNKIAVLVYWPATNKGKVQPVCTNLL